MYLEGADIEGIIQEGYYRTSKRVKKTTSKLESGDSVPSTVIEVDMGREIGTNSNGNGSYSILRTIITDDGTVLSSFPVANRQIIE